MTFHSRLSASSRRHVGALVPHRALAAGALLVAFLASGGCGSSAPECVSNLDCQGTHGPTCVIPSCSEGRCITTPKAPGADSIDTPHDCQITTCDGAGGWVTVADDADLPDDGNPCTLDICTAGVPSHAPNPACP